MFLVLLALVGCEPQTQETGYIVWVDDTAGTDTADTSTEDTGETDPDTDTDTEVDTSDMHGGVVFPCVGPWPTPSIQYPAMTVHGWVTVESLVCPGTEVHFWWIKANAVEARSASETDPRVVTMPFDGYEDDVFTLVLETTTPVVTECTVTWTSDLGQSSWPIKFQ